MNTLLKLMVASVAIAMPLALVAADATRSFVVVDQSPSRALPFSDGVVAGKTLYLSGTLGLDPKTLGSGGIKSAQVPADPAAEAKLAMDSMKRSVEAAGFKMEDLVSVQVFCTDLSLYGTFNTVYRSYFHDHFPARAFVGVDKLVVGGAHFEVMGVAVKGSD
jgi:2-iminobutanoate/2-iminopropanoate deaminase